MNEVVVVEGLGKDFGAFTAVDAVDFTVRRQEIFGFLGPNGAGKTTTINMLATLLKPTRGRAELAGHNVALQPIAVRQAIGMVFQDPFTATLAVQAGVALKQLVTQIGGPVA